MPCDICHSLLVRKNGTILCPSCNKIQLLERNTTVNVLQKNLDDVEAALFSLVKKRGFDKTKLLDALTWQREKFARDFFEVYQGFDLIKFLTLNLLIFRLMKEDFQGNGLPSDEEIEDMIRAFSDYLRMKHMYLLFKNGFAEAIRSNGKIRTIPNERYFPIEKSYEDSLIVLGAKANKKIKHFKMVFDLIYKGAPRGYLSSTPKEIIERSFPVINQFYCALLRNEFYDEIFGLLDKYREIKLVPGKLMDFVNSYQFYSGTLSFTSVNEFTYNAKKHFGITEGDVKRFLLFGEKRVSNFPLFVIIDDAVSISHRTAFLIYILLHAIFYKEFFDKETERRSKEFEKSEVKKKFESIGWTYFTTLKHNQEPVLEIDGIATLKREMIVIECKGWRPIRPFYEYEKTRKYLIRDIKGIVNGQKYTKEIPKKIPSLIDKLSFVKNKMDSFDFNPSDYDKVKGLIVIRGFPPIREYRGIQILSINEIEKSFQRGKMDGSKI